SSMPAYHGDSARLTVRIGHYWTLETLLCGLTGRKSALEADFGAEGGLLRPATVLIHVGVECRELAGGVALDPGDGEVRVVVPTSQTVGHHQDSRRRTGRAGRKPSTGTGVGAEPDGRATRSAQLDPDVVEAVVRLRVHFDDRGVLPDVDL